MIWIEARLQRDGLEKSVFMHNITFQSHALYPQLRFALLHQRYDY